MSMMELQRGRLVSRTEVEQPSRTVPIVARSDVVVVGGGAAGVGAAVSAARSGLTVTLLERYAYLGGLASGGMVLVLDDMVDGDSVTVTGLVSEYIERMATIGLAVYPPEPERGLSEQQWRKWKRWGLYDFHFRGRIKPIVFAVAFDPDGWKRVSDNIIREAGVRLRLHSWFSSPIIEDHTLRGVICETKAGPQAVMAEVVIDATGDLDVASRAGAPYTTSTYMVTLVFRLGAVDVDAAQDFEVRFPEQARELNRQAKRILGGAWELWWLRTPLPGVIWCNCPHLTGLNGADPEDLTGAEFVARERITALVDFARDHLPGFGHCYVLDVAEHTGVRQSRLLQGEYVVTQDDVTLRRHFSDSVCRGRDYYTPYRALLPLQTEQLLVAGRHYSATPAAQRMSREIAPCMAMGEAAGVAAALAVSGGITVRNVDPLAIQARLRAQGADPGDIPARNATVVD